ncbi:MAG: MFS family permease [Bacteroidia bacterium]|jgi:MFS family permease
MFYGWRVVSGTFISQLFIVGFFTYAASLLTPALQLEFDASLEQVMYGMTIGTLTGLFLSPLAGALVDRVPVRLLMCAGSLFFAGGLALMARAETLGMYVWAFGLTLAISNGLGAMIPCAAVVSRWFTVSRGRALGVAAIGTSAGGAIVPALMEYWLENQGWRGALNLLSLATLLVMLPAVFLLIRGRPEDVGLSPEAVPGELAIPESTNVDAKQILNTANFWYMALSMGIVLAAYSAVLANLTPYAISAGLDGGAGARLIMIVAMCGFVGKLLFGSAADKLNLKHALWMAQALAIVAVALFAQATTFMHMGLAAACMGLAAGGLLPVWGAMVARLFGLSSYGLAMGLMAPVVTLCILPTFVIVGRLVDTYGSFTYPMYMFSVTTAMAMIILLPLRLEARAAG